MSGTIDLATLPEEQRTLAELFMQVPTDIQDMILAQMREMVASHG